MSREARRVGSRDKRRVTPGNGACVTRQGGLCREARGLFREARGLVSRDQPHATRDQPRCHARYAPLSRDSRVLVSRFKSLPAIGGDSASTGEEGCLAQKNFHLARQDRLIREATSWSRETTTLVSRGNAPCFARYRVLLRDSKIYRYLRSSPPRTTRQVSQNVRRIRVLTREMLRDRWCAACVTQPVRSSPPDARQNDLVQLSRERSLRRDTTTATRLRLRPVRPHRHSAPEPP